MNRDSDHVDREAVDCEAIRALRSASYNEVEPSPDFNEKVMSRWRAEQLKKTVSYWMPAGIAAAITALALLAVLQWSLIVPGQEKFESSRAEARLDSSQVQQLPDFSEAE